MKEYIAVLEQGPCNCSAYVPDLPGCAAAGETQDETLRLIQKAIEFHLEGMAEDGESIPEPRYTGPGFVLAAA